MDNYQEFYFLKNWQRLLLMSVMLLLLAILRILFLSQETYLLSLLMGVLLFFALWLLGSICKNKKIVISNDFISFENHFLGFKQQNFTKNSTQILLQKQFGLTKITLNDTKHTVCIYPLFWGNKNGYHLLGLL